MSFLKSLFETQRSAQPEDYPKMYFRWEKEGREFGPSEFRVMIIHNWSRPPIQGRFENETKWREYSFFVEILSHLKASKEQIEELNRLNIMCDESEISFKEALRLIEPECTLDISQNQPIVR